MDQQVADRLSLGGGDGDNAHKDIMLAADLFAACGTAGILLLHSLGSLTFLRLCVITFALSLMNAFQVPAAYVATSLLIPKDKYARAGGLQAVSGAVEAILAPALGAAVMAWGGLNAVLCIDLCTFAVALPFAIAFYRRYVRGQSDTPTA